MRRIGYQAAPNDHVIRAIPQRNMDGLNSHGLYPSRTSGRVAKACNTACAISAME